ncbi:DNA repair protein RecN [Microbacterium esteraromaticum]|uniref:DNA repair protein RecN n=1 Tax=Microbacterium esteraromaticum TaxID=57043 RepID=A0A939IWV4_9MICO|nr:DNA repair protein RecN [Microbacterium esteraromaticum]MBN8207113.1 DNA repair protein RecN [Microbacterium esteraromaticum]MBN8417267.1 DNA repair protein RecN [Microbacterium esteraromaticum]
MIDEMRIRGLGVIDDAVLPLGPGFTAVTGETGAGKTMVVTGLGLLLGARADSSAIRAGASQASVAGVWVVPQQGAVTDIVTDAGGELEPAGDAAELYVSRTLSAEGRSRASVGGRPAPAAVLSALAEELVVVHGQSDQLRLRSAAAQRDALDRFGGQGVADAVARYSERYQAWRALDAEITELSENRDRRAAEAAQLREQLAEIEQLEPQPGEDVELNERAERLANAEELRVAASVARSALSSEEDAPDVTALVAEARRALERAPDPQLAGIAEGLTDLGYRTADLALQLSGYLADLDDSGPHELAAVEERRAAIGGLIRQHGSLEAALEVWRTGSLRLAELDDDGDRIERLEADAARVRDELDEAASALTAVRTDAAARLSHAVTEELHALAMPDARFEARVSAGAESRHGRDDVALLLAPHPGAEPRSVSRGASGGELSRVMLAIEVVIAGTDPVPTFVFDEVDAGIGGAAAIEVGRRLAQLARTSQVIAVTHLAQVAAFATNHLSVVKSHDGAVTASSVTRLSGEPREAEMARLLSGLADSDAALTHARELLSLGSSAT